MYIQTVDNPLVNAGGQWIRIWNGANDSCLSLIIISVKGPLWPEVFLNFFCSSVSMTEERGPLGQATVKPQKTPFGESNSD